MSSILSDMASQSQRITIRVPGSLAKLLRQRSCTQGQTPSQLVRVALQQYLSAGTQPRTAYDAFKEAGLIGCLKNAPSDLSTNPRYFEGFGKDK
jgi:ribbon-helix-helix CopG family protein